MKKRVNENKTLNVVLVEPQIPQNAGNVARTCAATGCRLHLVGPMGFVIDDKKLKRSGLDYWHLLDISYHDNIGAFFHEISCGELSASDPTPDTSGFEFYYYTTKAGYVYTTPKYLNDAYIFFGSETKGLDEALLLCNAAKCVRLPMLSGARSMNLANTVAVGVFEVLRQWGFPKLQNYGVLENFCRKQEI